MRTLQEKYNAIQEGRFSKDQFLRDARLQLPNLITQYNGYDDAVQILKNRGMIKENKLQENFTEYSDDALTDMIVNLSRYEGNEEDIRKIKQELGKRKGQVNEARLTKKSLTDYRYKPTNEMDNYPYEQILRGLRVELETMGIEGTPTAEEYQKALAKVLKNLEKDEIFYTNQVAGVKANRKRTDLMIDATPKNEVDKENGLQKAQLKEAVKKIIKNILSEDFQDPDLFDPDEEREERRSRYGQNEFGDGEEVYEMFAEGPQMFETTDKEADKDMVRKFMTMYETDPSKFERLHKQAQVQAKTNSDIKYKHLLSLLDRAKAGALQSLANQDRFEADREGIDEIGMFHDPIGYKKSKPNPADKIYTKEYQGNGVYKIFKNGKLIKTIEGEGNANAWMNQAKRADREGLNESVSLKDLLD
jgi:hypothetical protein